MIKKFLFSFQQFFSSSPKRSAIALSREIITKNQAPDLVFSSAPMPVCLMDDNGRIIRMNGKFKTVFSSLITKSTHKQWFQYFEIDQTMMPQHEGLPLNQLDEEKTQEEIDLIFYQGEILNLKRILLPLLLGQRDVLEIAVHCPQIENSFRISFFRILHDTTVQRTKNAPTLAALFYDNQMEYQLRRKLSNIAARDAIGQLVGGIAHDFNNMITATKGSIEALLETIPPRATGYADLQRIQQSCAHASEFVKQIMGLSRDIKTECHSIDFSYIVEGIEPLLLRLFPRDVLIDIYHDAGNNNVMGNELQIEQMIVNIALNARDAMEAVPEKKHIFSIKTSNVTLHEPIRMQHGQIVVGEYLCVALKDTGSGVPKEILDRIFEPFFTTKDVGKGSGLGLGMVNSIIQQMGGSIAVENNSDNGATFLLYFALAEQQNIRAITSSDEGILQTKKNIMLVDDEPAVRYFTAKLLRKYGYEVIEAEDGISAMKIAKAEMPDLLITDMRMPRMDGVALTHEIKKLNENLPVICISGFVRDEAFAQISHFPHVAFISKPYDAQQFKKTLEDTLYQAYIDHSK